MQVIDEYLMELGNNIGLKVDVFKTMIVLLISIIVSPYFFYLSSSTSRINFSWMPSVIILLFLIKWWEIIIVVSFALVSYIILNVLHSGHYFFSLVFCSIMLLIIHLHRFVFDYQSWKIDCSVLVMIMVTKIIYYALFLEKQFSHLQDKTKIQVKTHSFFHYIGYTFFFPTVSIGPTLSFNQYLLFINKKHQYQKISILSKLFIPLYSAIILTIVSIYLMPIFTTDWVLNNQIYLSWSLPIKLLSLNVIGFFYRLKFYTAWSLTQTAINFTGISWDGKNYQAVKTGDLQFEIQLNPKIRTQFWNTSIQNWLKIAFYDKIINKYKSPIIAMLGTFMASAYWHGIYWTYYVGFIQWGMLIHITKWIYKLSYLLPKKINDFVLFRILILVCANTSINYIGMLIVLLQWQKGLLFYQQLYYIPTIIILILFITSLVINLPRPKKQ